VQKLSFISRTYC